MILRPWRPWWTRRIGTRRFSTRGMIEAPYKPGKGVGWKFGGTTAVEREGEALRVCRASFGEGRMYARVGRRFDVWSYVLFKTSVTSDKG